MAERLDLPMSIGGIMVSWGHHRLVVGGKWVKGITSFGWGDKLDSPLFWDSDRSRAPIGRGKGKYDPGDIKIKGNFDSMADLKLEHAKASTNGRSAGFGLLLYNLQFDLGDDSPEREFEFQGVRYLESPGSLEENGEALQCEATCQPMRVRQKIRGIWVTIYDSTDEVQ